MIAPLLPFLLSLHPQCRTQAHPPPLCRSTATQSEHRSKRKGLEETSTGKLHSIKMETKTITVLLRRKASRRFAGRARPRSHPSFRLFPPPSPREDAARSPSARSIASPSSAENPRFVTGRYSTRSKNSRARGHRSSFVPAPSSSMGLSCVVPRGASNPLRARVRLARSGSSARTGNSQHDDDDDDGPRRARIVPSP